MAKISATQRLAERLKKAGYHVEPHEVVPEDPPATEAIGRALSPISS
jgi:hypothetical protein